MPLYNKDLIFSRHSLCYIGCVVSALPTVWACLLIEKGMSRTRGRGLRRYQRAVLLPLRLMGHSQEDKIEYNNEIKICSRASRGRRQARCTSKIILHQKNPLHSCLPRHLRSDSEVKKRIASRAPPAPYELWTPNTRSICRAIIFYKLHLI